MALMQRFGNLFRGNESQTDDFNPDLELPVRQLLQLTNSQYERDRMARLQLLLRYYRNTQYDHDFLQADFDVTTGMYISQSTDLGADLQVQKKLWAGIRPLFSV